MRRARTATRTRRAASTQPPRTPPRTQPAPAPAPRAGPARRLLEAQRGAAYAAAAYTTGNAASASCRSCGASSITLAAGNRGCQHALACSSARILSILCFLLFTSEGVQTKALTRGIPSPYPKSALFSALSLPKPGLGAPERRARRSTSGSQRGAAPPATTPLRRSRAARQRTGVSSQRRVRQEYNITSRRPARPAAPAIGVVHRFKMRAGWLDRSRSSCLEKL